MALAPLNNEVIFKKMFRDPEILAAFVKDLIGIDLDPQTIVIEQEKKFVPPIGGVDTEMDIFVDDPQHRIVIEIQRVWYTSHHDRFLHYWLAAIVELVKGYLNYELSRTVYVIVWLMQKVEEKEYQSSIITTSFCSETHRGDKKTLYPHKLYCLNPHYADESTPSGVADWMKLVMESIKHPKSPQLNMARPIIQKAAQAINDDGLTPQERAKAIDIGEFEEKLQDSETKGIKQGLQEGLQEGIQQEKRETARKMLAKGYDLAEVAELTGLSPDQFANLQH